MAKTISLPPVKKLFQESWKTFTASLLKLFVFGVLIFGIAIVYWFLAILVGGGLAAATGVFGIFSQSGVAGFAAISPLVYLLASIYFVLFLIGLVVLSTIGSIVPVLIVGQYPKQLPIGTYFKSSFSLILPLFITSLLVGIINVGGLFLFVFPAILFAFFFMFVNYEVILNKQKFPGALKRSVLIVSRNFGEILMRIILYFLLFVFLVVFIPNLIIRIEPKTGVLINLLSMLVNLLTGWFGLCFSVTLYKQAKVGMEKEKGGSITWIWIVSLLGWLAFFFLVFAGFKLLTSSEMKSFLEKQNESTSNKTLDFQLYTNDKLNLRQDSPEF